MSKQIILSINFGFLVLLSLIISPVICVNYAGYLNDEGTTSQFEIKYYQMYMQKAINSSKGMIEVL